MRISDWSSDVCSSDLNEADPGACVHATYQSAGALFWHNVSWVCDDMIPSHAVGDLNIRSGLPHGIDALKLGVAAALAIREARLIHGGPFSVPLGGATSHPCRSSKISIPNRPPTTEDGSA